MGVRRPSARRRNDRHDVALAAAIEVIAARGADQTRYRDIAERSDIPIATLQYMFGSLENLVLEALETAMDGYRGQTRELLAQIPEPRQRLEMFIGRNVGEDTHADRVQWRMWMESWYRGINDPPNRERMSRNSREWQEMLLTILTEGRAAGVFRADLDLADATTQIFGLLDGIGAALILQTEQADPKRVRRLVLDAALRIVR